jgi:hypothetical protein
MKKPKQNLTAALKRDRTKKYMIAHIVQIFVW